MPIGPDKEVVHKVCPFKAAAGVGRQQEVGRATSPREMCTHACALYDNKEGACAILVLAIKMSQPLTIVLQGMDTDALEKRLL
ncbi:MAG: hypothetical protein GTO55_06965 [Armatimonadetes bacterium]|nr:hypothetical protein [Armatimonadota bacterium]NIM24015.1 hypothetical protein [Armatimonadota bacterium]NIM67865.1 hypothetical protein [Armatimonadota bacterium]NIM76396.1 hypothetical protein [Armatimonadota bacterium]NIN06095.1 hypothetical protein [Armatimonadota bacterium]